MIERIADELLPSVEALGLEELGLGEAGVVPDRKIYLPVVVTTAKLWACFFEPEEIDLLKGELTSAGNFEEIPFLRFRKGLSTYVTTRRKTHDLRQASTERHRTIMIINSRFLIEFLKAWELPYDASQGWPWIRFRGTSS